ncbi:hypothetical protein MCAP1_002998 [Malassezia caprae]|uniref:Flavin reductase like domain-containing protein n=1 Tax=Malassezia caprae TaxID=1381934 RepID=A0AAF0EDH3_9BASI|nr:hypothetical protein MCAP1_002998 [Malassezia caprae]
MEDSIIYGYQTNTQLTILLFLDQSARGVPDADVQTIFQAIHRIYGLYTSNPFVAMHPCDLLPSTPLEAEALRPTLPQDAEPSKTPITSDVFHQRLSDLEAIRGVMRRSAQPIAVVSAFLPEEASNPSSQLIHCTTLSSFTTVSLAPPLVAFSIRLPSRMADALRAGASIPLLSRGIPSASRPATKKPHFMIHILSSTQESLSNYFARPGAVPFDAKAPKDDSHPFHSHPMQLSASVPGMLIPSESLGSLACSLVYQLDLTSPDLHGTTEFLNGCAHTEEVGSTLFLAQIHDVELGPQASERDPLVYWHQKYGSLQLPRRS